MNETDWHDPHPPSRHCMCPDCIPSFDDRFAELAQLKKERDRWEYLARIAEPEYLAMKARAEKAEQERDHAVAATRELLATNIRSCALSRTTRGIDGMIRDELLRLAERVKTNAWEQ